MKEMEERITNLEERITNLEEMRTKDRKTIDILKYTIKDILTQNNQDNNTNSDSSNLVKKDRVLIQSLLERAKQEFHIKFLSNILSGSYDTLTQKQNKVLVDIQNSI